MRTRPSTLSVSPRFWSLTAVVLVLALVLLWAQRPAAALGVNSQGNVTVTDGALTPGGVVTLRFAVTPVADSAAQDDYADGFIAFLPVGWTIQSIGAAPQPTAVRCGGGHTIGQAFANPTAESPAVWPVAYWGHLEGSLDLLDATGYRLPAGSECGVYAASAEPGAPLLFTLTAAIPADAPTCPDGSVALDADPAAERSLFGLLLSDGYAAPGTGAWAAKDYALGLVNACQTPTAVALTAVAQLWSGLGGGAAAAVVLLAVATTWAWRRGRRAGALLGGLFALAVLFAPAQATAPSQGYNSSNHDLQLAGPYAVGSQTVSVTRVLSGSSGSFGARLYFPATPTGGAYNPAGAPYPAIVFAHGFQQVYTRYASLLEHLASRGYFVLAIDTQNSLFPNHNTYALEVRDGMTYFDRVNANPASPWFQQVASGGYGLVGHSMGGGAVIQAAGFDDRVGALAALAPAQLSSGGADAIAAAATISAPTALIVGSADTVVPTGTNAQPMYANVPTARQLLNIEGADHCDFQDTVFPWRDASFCGPLNALPLSEGLAISRRLITAFFGLHLQGDARRLWRAAWGPEHTADPALATRLSDPRVTLTATGPTFQSGSDGALLTYTLLVGNNTAVPQTVALRASANRWEASLDQTAVTLEPGATQAVTATVRLPANAAAKWVREDTLLATATTADGAAAFVELTGALAAGR